MIELIWLLGGVAIGVILALLLARSKRGDALLDRILDWASALIAHDSPVRDELTEKFLELLTESKSGSGKKNSANIK